MLAAESGVGAQNGRLTQGFEDYRKACREKYLQQASVQTPINEEEVEEKGKEMEQAPEVQKDACEVAPQPRQIEAVDNSATINAATAQLQDVNITTPTSPSLEAIRKSGKTERRNSLSKFISGVFSKKSSSPSIKKKMSKEEKEEKEQDWRMARFIAELEYEGKSDQEIQMQLFQIRDQSQFGRPSNSVGDWFKSMHQAFKDEFSVRRDSQLATVHAAAMNPFNHAAPSANYMHDIPYTYEQLVALENVPRGVKNLDHLAITTYEGQELPSAQTTCAVCMMDFEKSEELRGLHCTHHFHKDCIDRWLAVGTTCPVCKKDCNEMESDA